MISGAGPSPRWVVPSPEQVVQGSLRGKRGKLGAVARRPKVQRGQIIKMSGLYREEPLGERQPSHWAGEFSVADWLCKPYPVTGRN